MKIYQVDAFSQGPFTGNPAAVVPLQAWLPDETMQQIAMENNLSETAFFIPQDDGFALRWFTPSDEVDLCGHATFATAFVVFNKFNYNHDRIIFYTRSGELYVSNADGGLMEMNLPTDQIEVVELSDDILDALGGSPVKTFEGREDYLVIYDEEEDIRELAPDFEMLRKNKVRGVIASAPGESVDFVSRCFYPGIGIDEDPGTGSAHTAMAPYWASRLNKDNMIAKQISKRGSYFEVKFDGERTILRGKGQLFLEGEIFI